MVRYFLEMNVTGPDPDKHIVDTLKITGPFESSACETQSYWWPGDCHVAAGYKRTMGIYNSNVFNAKPGSTLLHLEDFNVAAFMKNVMPHLKNIIYCDVRALFYRMHGCIPTREQVRVHYPDLAKAVKDKMS